MPITIENLDAAFTYHPWSECQVAKGQPIRAAAKAATRAFLEAQKSICDLYSAIDASAPSESPESDLAQAAKERRQTALSHVEKWRTEGEAKIQEIIGTLGLIVMLANQAITFEAANLVAEDKDARPQVTD